MSVFNEESTATDVAAALSAHIAGKVILITGCSPNGLGATAALAMAPHKPALLILAGRTRKSIEETEKAILGINPEIKTRILLFDLSSLESVREAAEEVCEYEENIDVLINNAGIMAAPYEKTKDGFESQFGVNHLGPFLLTNLILGKIKRGGRIVNVSSNGYIMGPVRFDDPNFEQPDSYQKWAAYGQSKSANILFAQALAKRLGPRGLFAFSLDIGGGVMTNIGRFLTEEDFALLSSVPKVTLDQAASTYIAASFDPKLEAQNGAFLRFCKPARFADTATWLTEKGNPQKLWSLSEKLVSQTFDM